MITFDLATIKQQQELLITSIFWEMQACMQHVKTLDKTTVIGRIAALQYVETIKNYSLYKCDLENDCETWEQYCVKALGKTLKEVEVELFSLHHLYQELKKLNKPTVTKDNELILATKYLAILKTLARDLLNIQASA